MSNRHAEIARAIFTKAWGQGDFSDVADAMAGSFAFHVGGTSRQMDLSELRQVIGRWREGFPDLRFAIDDLIADGGVVAIRARLLGTHAGRWGDREPTGHEIDVQHMFFLRFEGDRLVEVFELLDQEALRSQLAS